MKKLALNIGMILSLFQTTRGQYVLLDTIGVSSDKTTYLVFDRSFDANSDFIDLGTNEFESKIEDKTVFLKAAVSLASPTSLMIKNGDNYYHGVIKYLKNPRQTFYDYRLSDSLILHNKGEPQIGTLLSLKPENKESPDKSSLTNERLKTVMARPVELHTLGLVKDRLTLAVTNIFTDEYATYIKILFHNRSSGSYEIDFVNFQYSEPSGKRRLKKSPGKRTDVFPITQTGVQAIPAYHKEFLGYALPLFNISNKGKLIITFREQNGSRIMRLHVPFKALSNTKVF